MRPLTRRAAQNLLGSRPAPASGMVRVRVEQEEPSTWPAFEGVGLRATGLVSPTPG